jgi:hydrogenase-4 component E
MTMSYASLLELSAGAVLVCAIMTLWRRRVRTIVSLLRLQGLALAGVASVLAVHERNVALGVTAILVLLVKGLVAPELLRRVVRRNPESRETSPLINVPASLIIGAALIVVAYAVSAKITAIDPSPATRLVPIGLATVLVGYLMLVTRRRAISQIVGLLLVDNGIALITFLLTSGVPLIVELGSALDVLLVVVVLQVLVVTVNARAGSREPAEMTELRD